MTAECDVIDKKKMRQKAKTRGGPTGSISSHAPELLGGGFWEEAASGRRLSLSVSTVFGTGAATYQLKLPAAVVGVLDARVGPQGPDGGHVLQEDARLQLPARHLGGAGVERHQALPVLLVVFVSPGDVQLFPGVHQHAHTCKEAERRFTKGDFPGQICANSPLKPGESPPPPPPQKKQKQTKKKTRRPGWTPLEARVVSFEFASWLARVCQAAEGAAAQDRHPP